MFHADELIAAIRRRRRRSLRPEQSDVPSDRGLDAWLGQSERESRPHSSRPAGLLAAAMLERGRFRAVTEPAAPNRLAAWLRLWRQQWERAPRDQRALRWFAAVVSGVLNIGFALALLWLMYLRFVLMLPPVTPLAGAPAGAGGAPLIPSVLIKYTPIPSALRRLPEVSLRRVSPAASRSASCS